MASGSISPNPPQLITLQPRAATPSAAPDSTTGAAATRDGFTKQSPLLGITLQPTPLVRAAPSTAAADPGEIPHITYQTDEKGTTATVNFIYDADKRKALSNLTLVGSWDNLGRFSNDQSALPMTPGDNGKYNAKVTLDASNPNQAYTWKVLADGPSGKQQLAMFSESAISFVPKPGVSTQLYAPRTYAQMGLTQWGADARVKVWGASAANVALKVWDDPDKPPRTIPLTVDADQMWSTELPGQWKDLVGKSYGFAVTDTDGNTVIHADPYARQLQGQLRGVSDLYLNPQTGKEENKYFTATVAVAPPTPPPAATAPTNGRVNAPENDSAGVPQPPAAPLPGPGPTDTGPTTTTVGPVHFQRFEVQQEAEAEKVFLRLSHGDGSPLNKADLEKLLGTKGADLARKNQESYWQDHCQADGRISLDRAGADAWTTVVNNPDALLGLKYTFEVWQKDPQGNLVLVGDANHDGQLSVSEARQTAFNDNYDNTLKNVGSQRLSVVRSDDFDWKNPRPNIPKNKAIIYQAHVGSFMGDAKNVRRSTFKDLIDNLDYFKELGVNTIELLPTNPFEGMRDWGYIGTSSLAVAEQYGFKDDNGRWVCGPEALKRFVDAAHGKGLAVMDDVVYNHFGGDYNNLWNWDGKQNSYFKWGINTPWGPMPSMDQKAPSKLITDSSSSRIEEYGFDGKRLDFTNPIHADNGGGLAGWLQLRSDDRQDHYFEPNTTKNFEEFPPSPIMTTPPGPNLTGGAGADGTWNTEFQHRLVHDNSGNSIIQQAVNNQHTDIDRFLNYATQHPGFLNEQSSVTIISDHDEVGNADRTFNVIRNYRADGTSNPWEREMARSAFANGMLSSGVPLFFQGEESLAENTFKWGVPSTWDVGWSWRNNKMDIQEAAKAVSQGQEAQFVASQPADAGTSVSDIYRRLHFEFCKKVIALRNSSDAFNADVPEQRVYSHNDNSLMAFSRESGNDKFLVVHSLNRNNLASYNIPVDEGKWELVLDSDSKDFGGAGVGRGEVLGGDQARFDIPAGGVLVYKKVQ